MNLTKLSNAVEDYQTSKSLSQNELAKQLGISADVLISVKRNRTDRISDKMYRRLMSYFRIEEAWQLAETGNHQLITSACKDAQENKRMIGIYGNTGYGKTTSLEWYSNNTTNVFYLLAKNLWSRKDFLIRQQKALGIRQDGSLSYRMETITAKLNSLEDPLLVIDDAGKLSDNVFKLIQNIFDDCEGNAGIILAGTEEFERDFRKKVSRNKSQFPELYRRVGYWQELNEPSDNAVVSICKLNGITDTGAVKYLRDHVTNFGTLREWIRNAKLLSERLQQAISVDLLQQVKIS